MEASLCANSIHSQQLSNIIAWLRTFKHGDNPPFSRISLSTSLVRSRLGRCMPTTKDFISVEM